MPHDLSAILNEVEEHGFCVVPDVLVGAELDRVQHAFRSAIDESKRRGLSVYDPRLDANDRNVRVNNLPDMDPVFVELLRHPLALDITHRMLGENAAVSNFTANVSYPGAASMMVHSDQALVGPSPWTEPWVINIIWCLDDVRPENGATLYLPGSHRISSPEELPDEPIPRMKHFVAPVGSFIVMDGRLWHTSGINVTKDERRALMFAFYSRDFVRGQVNWAVLLSDRAKAGLNAQERTLLGLDPINNVSGSQYVMRPGYTVETVDIFSPVTP